MPDIVERMRDTCHSALGALPLLLFILRFKIQIQGEDHCIGSVAYLRKCENLGGLGETLGDERSGIGRLK